MTDDDTRVQEIVALLAIAGWACTPETVDTHLRIYTFWNTDRTASVRVIRSREHDNNVSTNGGFQWALDMPFYPSLVRVMEKMLHHIIQGDS